jgi:beta-galactosidase
MVPSTRSQVGFRDVRIGRRQLLINGRAVMIKGVNRHEHDERRGKAITEVSSRCFRKNWMALM